MVSNSPIAVPREPWIERVVVGAGMDAADDWIAERAGAGDIVITADVPLASRAVKAGAAVIAPNGKAFDDDSIGMSLATRNLLHELRGAGAITGGPKPFTPRDRSEFLSALDRAIVRIKRTSGAFDPAVTRERVGQIEQRFVAAGPADQRQSDRATLNRADRDRHLRQPAEAGNAGEPHDAGAVGVHLRRRRVDFRRDAGRARQRNDGAGLDLRADVIARGGMDLARGVGLGLA